MMKLGGFFTMTSSWLKSLFITVLFGILLGTMDIVKLPFTWFYPERDSIGGVAFPLGWVAGGQQQPSRLEFVFVRQSLKPMTTIEFIRRDPPVKMNDVFAGLAAKRTGGITSLNGRVANGVRLLSLQVPEKTIGGMTIALGLTPSGNGEYVLMAGDVTKELVEPSDLVIQTKNEARRTAVVYFFIILCVAIVSFYVARARPLRHPKDQSPEDAQWV